MFFSKQYGPMLSISRFVHMFVCVYVCLSVCSLLRNRLNFFCPHFLKLYVQKLWSQIWKILVIKGVKLVRRTNFARIRRLYNKDQEVILQGLRGFTTKIRRLYNKDQEVMFSDSIIEPHQKTLAYKGCKITAQIFFFFFFLRIFSYHQDFFGICASIRIGQEMLSPECGIFVPLFRDCTWLQPIYQKDLPVVDYHRCSCRCWGQHRSGCIILLNICFPYTRELELELSRTSTKRNNIAFIWPGIQNKRKKTYLLSVYLKVLLGEE